MAEKKKKNLDEDVIRYIYNSKFFPETVFNDDGPADFYDEKIFELLNGAKSFEESRNRLIRGIKDEDILQRARRAANEYFEGFGSEEDSYDGNKAFMSPLERTALNVSAMPYEKVKAVSDDIAGALGYLNGVTSLLVDMDKQGEVGFNEYVARQVRQKMKDETIDKEKLLRALDLSPEADEDYIAQKINDYVSRVKLKRDHDSMNPVGKAAQSFILPYTEKSLSEGKMPSITDTAIDILSNVAPAKAGVAYGKSKNGITGLERLVEGDAKGVKGYSPAVRKSMDMAGLGVLTGALEPFVSRFDNAVNAFNDKRVYENEGDLLNEVSERGNVADALALGTLMNDVGEGISHGFQRSLVGLGGRVGSKAIQNGIKRLSESKIGRKATDAISRLFGEGGSKKTAASEYRKLQKEKAVLNEEINEFAKNPGKIGTENYLLDKKRLAQIERHEDKIRDLYVKTAGDRLRTGIDALSAYGVMKAGLNPKLKAEEAAKTAYAIDWLIENYPK